MRVILLLFIFSVIQLSSVFSQSVRETKVSILDKERFSYQLELNMEQKILEEAWSLKADELKIKNKMNKGFLMYENVTVNALYFDPIDLYVKFEKVDKVKARIYIAVSKGLDSFITSSDATVTKNMQDFLLQFGLFADQYKLQLDIKAQEELIKKTIKEYDKLVEEGKKIQQELELNKSAQETKNNDIITLQQALSVLRGKLK